MMLCKRVFAAVVTLLCVCVTACAPSTDAQRQSGQYRVGSSAQADANDNRLAELRDLKADVTTEIDRHGRQVLSIDLTLVGDVTPALRIAAALPSVDRLNLMDAELHSEDIELLRHLSGLRWLDLSNSTVTDADLSFLESTPRLEFLLLWGTRITDASLPRVSHLARLQKLDLSATKITSDGLKHLATLRDLMELYIEVPGIGAQELKQLQAQLPNTLIVD